MKTDTDTGKFSDVPVRVKSWGYIIAVFVAMLLHPFLMYVIVSLLSLYALKEYFTMTSLKNKTLLYLIYFVIIPVSISFFINNYLLFALSIILYIAFLLIVNKLFIREKNQNRNIIIGIILCVFFIGHLSFLRNLNNLSQQIMGLKLVLFIVLLTELNDVFQYLTGKTFGKRKITPKISPNKTLEGFFGGIILTTFLANILGLFLLPHKSFLVYTALGALIAVLGFCGDVFMSFIKRKARVKDTGNLIPGHGGLLDRLDSLLFVLPIAYWIIVLMYFK